MENEIAEWKQYLLVKGQRSLERAVKQASQTSLEKVKKASDLRRSREKLHKDLLERFVTNQLLQIIPRVRDHL